MVISSKYLLWRDAADAIKIVFSSSNLTISYEEEYERFLSEAYVKRVLLKAQMEGRSKFEKIIHVAKIFKMNIWHSYYNTYKVKYNTGIFTKYYNEADYVYSTAMWTPQLRPLMLKMSQMRSDAMCFEYGEHILPHA